MSIMNKEPLLDLEKNKSVLDNDVSPEILNETLNIIYDMLDSKTKEEVDKITNIETKNLLLIDLNDNQLKEIYDSLSEKDKKLLIKMSIRDKMRVLKRLRSEKKYIPYETNSGRFVQIENGVKLYVFNKTPLWIENLNTNPKFHFMLEDEYNNLYSSKINKDLNIESEEDIDNIEEINQSKTNPQLDFEKLIETYYSSNPYIYNSQNTPELEVRFGTRGIKPLTKNDYDNVIKKLKSLQFHSTDDNGINSLRIQTEFLNRNTGKFNLSNIRSEIYGLENIQKYCKNNSIDEMIKSNCVIFIKKNPVIRDNQKIKPVNFDDFNFRVSYVNEENLQYNKGNVYAMINEWKKSKKTFRYLNRVSFIHPDYPVIVDISIIKSTETNYQSFQKTFYTTDDAELFDRQPKYNIEIEIDNKKIGPGTNFNNSKSIIESLRKVIKFILSGLQCTNYPISYIEQKETLNSYMKLLHKENYNTNKRIYASDFIGPNSFTLQIQNIAPIDENSTIPNIRKDFTVTDKADGIRHLMYINDIGKIYLINTNMMVIFTGAKTTNKNTFNSLFDGELILNDKYGKFINLFAIFDVYVSNKEDVRALPFMQYKNKNINKMSDSRYIILKSLIYNLKAVSIISKSPTSDNKIKQLHKTNIISPMRFEYKKFYPENIETGNIFQSCHDILSRSYEYNTDGLIFTHAYFGVGANKINEASGLFKITWDYSFKWKPPQFNTIDFLITTIKSNNNEDVMNNLYEDGINVNSSNQINSYKTIQLRCTFSEKRHGYINPYQNILDDDLPEYKKYEDNDDDEYKPVQFYPTNPYDSDAGLCNIMLKKDNNNIMQMFTEEEEVFQDNTIVEFSYDQTREKGWRWIPLRVRYDKTTSMLQGAKNFGNAYHVANSNWQSIHNPITEEMITTGLNIPEVTVDEDIYYNKSSGISKTQSLKNFHNLYVKKMLIKGVSIKGDTLIDYACGKAGDLPKWISSQLSFVFGIDKSKDNLENKLDGACARYLNSKKQNKNVPSALFVNGNSSSNIRSGNAMFNDKAVLITKAVFGDINSDTDKLGKGVVKNIGKAKDGFNISSCQFAIHYFFQNIEILQGFLRNISECTKIGGYFIATAYDGQTIFNLLKNKNPGESVQIVEDNKKIWEITKDYDSDRFEDNSSSIGYKIDVYQESINQNIYEYLVNFNYLDRLMENYGFKLIDRNEAIKMGFNEGSGLFSELFINMLEEIKQNKFKAKDYGDAPNMTAFEKKISFLNRYVIYKKINNVGNVEVDIEDYRVNEKDIIDTQQAIQTAITENKINKTKVKKLNKKLKLIQATEGLDETPSKQKKQHKLIIIEDDEE